MEGIKKGRMEVRREGIRKSKNNENRKKQGKEGG